MERFFESIFGTAYTFFVKPILPFVFIILGIIVGIICIRIIMNGGSDGIGCAILIIIGAIIFIPLIIEILKFIFGIGFLGILIIIGIIAACFV